MSSRACHSILVVLALLALGLFARAGETSDSPYTDRGTTDFDTVLQLLNPYGTWSKIDGKWAYTPLDHMAPYTDGRWLYTEYGWYWKGRLPHSWATEHYGYWKRGANKVWSWYPGPIGCRRSSRFAPRTNTSAGAAAKSTTTAISWRRQSIATTSPTSGPS